jgi:hypothetical protein
LGKNWPTKGEQKLKIMKLKQTIVLMAAVALLSSCEPKEVLVSTFTPNTPDTTYISGMNMRLVLNGNAVNYTSQGYGISCTDTSGQTTWAAITGNGVVFDPATNSYSTAPNDTSLVLVFFSQNFGIGSYSIARFEDAVCILDAPGALFKQYDPTQLAINITRLTTDSIFGDYSGALREISGFTVDPQGNLVPTYTGVVDSVSTVFGVKRNPC